MTHFTISIIKSILRLVGVALAFYNMYVFVGFIGGAEVLGILEEVFDKRKES